ncbi:hypothetical protein [Robertmurraya massiliosenegalensis]|uniref:hypothetical protein n=1 Tax=Robertmurraya massiliosenegalensis TaxID=1287657 RepID=UPI0011DCFD46|nr:hypothetical protein [Robertmurraya massiliosenegalensis]
MNTKDNTEEVNVFQVDAVHEIIYTEANPPDNSPLPCEDMFEKEVKRQEEVRKRIDETSDPKEKAKIAEEDRKLTVAFTEKLEKNVLQ